MPETGITYLPILVIGVSVAYGCLAFYSKQKARQIARKATMRDYAMTSVFFVGMIAIAMTLRFSEIDEKKQMLRDQFALSDDIELIDFEHRGPSRNGTNSITRGVYRFTDAQLRAYQEKTYSPAQWQPKPISHAGNDLVASYTSKARAWTRFPKPLKTADMKGKKHVRELPWLYHLWWAEDYKNIKRGRLMCFVFEEVDRSRRSMLGRYEGQYQASACSERAKLNRTSATVLAILDYDKKTLAVTVD